MSEIEILTDISATLKAILRVVQGDYDDTAGDDNDVEVTNTLTKVADVDSLCAKRLVTNTGSVDIDVFENGKMVSKSLPPRAGWISDLDGGGEITVQCAGGVTGKCRTTTYRRNLDV